MRRALRRARSRAGPRGPATRRRAKHGVTGEIDQSLRAHPRRELSQRPLDRRAGELDVESVVGARLFEGSLADLLLAAREQDSDDLVLRAEAHERVADDGGMV